MRIFRPKLKKLKTQKEREKAKRQMAKYYGTMVRSSYRVPTIHY